MDESVTFDVNQKISLIPYERKDIFSMQEAHQKAGWGHDLFNIPQSWRYSEGAGIRIAVLDTGCQLDHPDLANNLLPGYNFIENNNSPIDKRGHGTHVTGIMVAENNSIGMVGVCPKAKVIPVKVLDDQGNGTMQSLIQGIIYAADMGADFISMSLGNPMPVFQVREAIRYAQSKGCITFAAAGNTGWSKHIMFPAAYPETIAVGAIDRQLRRAEFSNTGHNLDFMAPGVDIFSTVPLNWYALMSGTSMAQPFACGVSALLKSYSQNHPEKNIRLNTTLDYRNYLLNFTTPTRNRNGKTKRKFFEGYGILDPRRLSGSAT